MAIDSNVLKLSPHIICFVLFVSLLFSNICIKRMDTKEKSYKNCGYLNNFQATVLMFGLCTDESFLALKTYYSSLNKARKCKNCTFVLSLSACNREFTGLAATRIVTLCNGQFLALWRFIFTSYKLLF